MLQSQLNTLFDQQAASYDARWAQTAPIRDALYLLLDALFIDLPEDARILSVGVGTGGFEQPTLFYQAGLIHAWRSRKPVRQARHTRRAFAWRYTRSGTRSVRARPEPLRVRHRAVLNRMLGNGWGI